METRTVGQSGPPVGEIGYGAMGLTWAYGEPIRADREAEAIALIHRAIDLGVTLFDTAEVYGPFTNEELLGKALKGKRDQVVVATKTGFVPQAAGEQMRRDGRPETIKRAVEGSLRRLQTDVIDLYQLHRVDPNVPVEESVGAMAELVAAGKVRMLGLSEVDVETLQRANTVHPIATLQSELSLWTRDALPEILPWCKAHGVGFLAFSPLGRGFLTGRLAQRDIAPTDFRATLPRFQGENFDRNQRLVEQVEAVARRAGATNGQVALAWTLAQGQNVIPIPGTKRIAYLEENVGAAGVRLSVADLAELDALEAPVGNRYAAT
ncbi:MAG: aldo/keto reductase [Candidatus Eremiobacteraeota bacterium]|nr:aldo/keto reductase [Candidatus Eremiobacteraeota bacterium]